MLRSKTTTGKAFSTVILAAGKGKRMYSTTPKLLHTILGKPIILFVIDLARNIGSTDIVVVIGKKAATIKKVIGNDVTYAVQAVPRGTGDAVRKGLVKAKYGNILILSGDVPFLQKQTIQALIKYHKKNNADLTLLTCTMQDPSGYGRIVRNRRHRIMGIVEECDATFEQTKIKEMNVGIYYGTKQALQSSLAAITTNNVQGELYLTDIVKNLISRRKRVLGITVDREQEIMGINSKLDLCNAQEIVKRQWFEELMLRGIHIEDPRTTHIDLSVQIGNSVRIRPYTLIEGRSRIRNGTTVGPFIWIKNGKKMGIRCRRASSFIKEK